MPSFDSYVALLRCPHCRGSFSYEPHVSKDPAWRDNEFGILRCTCFSYPVVDSVPIMLKGAVAQFSFGTGEVESAGPSAASLVQLIAAGRGHEALVSCLEFTPIIEWLNRLPLWRIWHTGPVPGLFRSWVKSRVVNLLGDPDACVEDWLRLFFLTGGSPAQRNLFEYYLNRFSLPRTLATYSLLELLPTGDKPVLDIACGLGPFPHYMSNRPSARSIVGFDFNFYLAWLQRRFMAPGALFMCADAGNPLPFIDDSFDAVYCSDSFMFIPNRASLIEECDRCAPGRPLLLARVGNRTAAPRNWGDEQDAAGYLGLLKSARLFRELDLVRSYLRRRNPFDQPAIDADELLFDKWIYVAGNTGVLERARVDTTTWPHHVGTPTLNPIFRHIDSTNDKVRLKLRFPDTWFAYQNANMYAYHTDNIEWDPKLSSASSHGGLDPTMQFTLLGMPPRFLRKTVNTKKE
jgi:uncharacterized protein YbaR (Trm112 family)